jgi:type IV secretory pathway VirB10-like protein
MKMNNRDQLLNDDDGEETMVAPRFDDEETVLARPVVPLEEVGDAPAARASSLSSDSNVPLYSRLRVAPRRSLVAALVLVSVLAGSVLGVGGLYLYQKHRAADADAARQQQAEAPAAQPTVQTVTESPKQAASAPAQPSTPAPAAPEPEAQAKDDSDSSKEPEREEARNNKDDAAAERRNVSDDADSARAAKRGKKGARDEDLQRGAQRAPRYDEDDRPVVRDDDDDNTREARRVGVITYRPRRARQRHDRYDTPDRLRRIFEGQP